MKITLIPRFAMISINANSVENVGSKKQYGNVGILILIYFQNYNFSMG